ncbi:response regulator [Nesterenkonia lacusekhoensis]|uniref:DNA-binding NarL/FixJ family response regulator n=1 Tax=Nesterenkonia lacusekhoensis TaxID=150832 RepID=A0ABS4T2X3_9MICC|nr:response regulator transcription factor [Nesterenkonia lacusekhoensis]MBP2318797.1 DNA-binding NarL/FixJ family response regulator [Nesterenkonia lacusekhoensis]
MTGAERPTRVVLADDEPLMLAGLAAILDAQPDIEVLGTAADGRQAVDLVARTQPDVACLDIEMPVMNGIEATREILSRQETQVVMLTTFRREDYLVDSLQAGASGFLLKTATPEQLAESIRTVASGEALLAPEMTQALIRRTVHAESAAQDSATQSSPARDSTVEPLSQRERDVLAQAALGLSNSEIGERLFIGAETVKTHMSRVLAKLQLRNRVQAVAYAHRQGIVADSPE